MSLDAPHPLGADAEQRSHPTPVLDLTDGAAGDPARAGGKAAALARAHRAGFSTLPAAILPTELSVTFDEAGTLAEPSIDAALEEVLDRLGADQRLIVRSSSVVEDTSTSSQAGQFESVLGVVGVDELRAAVETVYRSRDRVDGASGPIAVLVQPMIDPRVAGVAFGIDPVSGRSDRRVVAAVAGTPDRLVSGEADGSRWALDPAGVVVDARVEDGVDLDRSTLRNLVDLGDRLADAFDGPQDVEWALDDDDGLLVLQTRPVTTDVLGAPSGPIYGPGPVAETFPEALTPLEVDLWVHPLREGVREALRISGAVADRDLDGRDLVVVVDGQVAIDLDLELAERRGFGRRMGARVRRLRSAWRIGRLRVALPALAHDLCARVDEDLESVPPLADLATRQLIALIGRGREGLRSLHAHEILMGLVSDTSASSFTGASVALRVLAEARRDGLDDEEIVRRAPVVLALVPPRVGGALALPEAAGAAGLRLEPPEMAAVQVSREALRMRVRWMQELVGQAAGEVGRRLVERGELDAVEEIDQLGFDEVAAVVAWQATVEPHALARAVRGAARVEHHRPASLPARFQVSDLGKAIAVIEPGQSGGGTGAGGGTARGEVTHDVEDPPEGSILVVGALTPQLGPVLGRLAGIVSETGSVLSHLAILARESGVAVVVGHRGALEALHDGTTVSVDGATGRVSKESA